jgi:membrane associated rhomboid family serine protease
MTEERLGKLIFWAIFWAAASSGLAIAMVGDSVAWWAAIGGAFSGLFWGWLENGTDGEK